MFEPQPQAVSTRVLRKLVPDIYDPGYEQISDKLTQAQKANLDGISDDQKRKTQLLAMCLLYPGLGFSCGIEIVYMAYELLLSRKHPIIEQAGNTPFNDAKAILIAILRLVIEAVLIAMETYNAKDYLADTINGVRILHTPGGDPAYSRLVTGIYSSIVQSFAVVQSFFAPAHPLSLHYLTGAKAKGANIARHVLGFAGGTTHAGLLSYVYYQDFEGWCQAAKDFFYPVVFSHDGVKEVAIRKIGLNDEAATPLPSAQQRRLYTIANRFFYPAYYTLMGIYCFSSIARVKSNTQMMMDFSSTVMNFFADIFGADSLFQRNMSLK